MFGLSTVCRDSLSKKIHKLRKTKKLFLSSFLTDYFSKDFKMPIGKQTASLQHQEFSLGNLPVSTGGLRIVLNIDDTPIVSKSHTHPSWVTLANLLSINLVSNFRCSSPPLNPVYVSRVTEIYTRSLSFNQSPKVYIRCCKHLKYLNKTLFSTLLSPFINNTFRLKREGKV
jgi:hypothetical protein